MGSTMKIGLNLLLWTTCVTEEHYPQIKRLKDLGYDGVEIPVMSGELADYKKLGSILKDLGLECTCSTALPGPQADPISPEAGIQQAGLDYLTWCIDCVEALDAKILCGPTYQALGQFTGEGPTEDEKERIIAFHKNVSQYAAAADVTIATEPLNRFECYFLNTLADADEHARLVDSDHFGILFDTFHANIEDADPVGTLRQNGQHIRHVHFSENHRGIPGQGHVDFTGTLQSLNAINYNGWIVAEVFGRALPDLAAATCIWRDMFNSTDQVCQETIRYISSLILK